MAKPLVPYESFTIFQAGSALLLVVEDGYLLEVDPQDENNILSKWDLKQLSSLEEERCDADTESVEFRLKFDTMRKQMRERSFVMGAKDFKRFDRSVSPFVEERTLREFAEALQCTKCYAQFARAMVGKKIVDNVEVDACPTCGFTVLVTLDAIPLPNNECLELDDVDLRGPLRCSTPVSGN
jgi:DNA-directed RNA polymerase subunit RPC12/RpoP